MRSLFMLPLALLFVGALHGQTGCPGCVVKLPPTLAADTVYLPALPPGEKGRPYSQDVSFRMPKTTTPVNKIDGVTPPGLNISKIEIVAVENLPPGLRWQANETVFDPSKKTDGCIKICGTPTANDTFVLTIRLKANVLFLSQETSFATRIFIAPETSQNNAFAMSNVTGCGKTTVSFKNNILSGGKPGFTYTWDFGDSTKFTGENPPPHLYSKPGLYKVSYTAKIDTAAVVLKSVNVLSVECADLVGLGSPDLYALLRDPQKKQIFRSPGDLINPTLPVKLEINQRIGAGNYTLEIWDEDGGLEGGDDPCGSVSFNILSGKDTLVANGFKVVLDLERPIREVKAVDTVIVYAVPIKPVIAAPRGTNSCEGLNNLLLTSSYGAGNLWLRNGMPIPDAVDFNIQPKVSGVYSVRVSSSQGCSATSDTIRLRFFPLPVPPVFTQQGSDLRLLNPSALPARYTLQWLLGDVALTPTSSAGLTYCATRSGIYTLRVTDLQTNCSNTYQIGVTIDPNSACLTGVGDLDVQTLSLSPNPAFDRAQVQFPAVTGADARFFVRDLTGRLLREQAVPAGATSLTLDCADLSAGLYLLEMTDSAARRTGKLAKAN